MYGSSVGLALQALKPSVVLNMVCFTAQAATNFIAIMRGLTKRVVVISSADVYLAFGCLHRSEAGPLQPMPLTEMSALRTTGRPQEPEYDKISVEKIIIGNPDLPRHDPALFDCLWAENPLHRLYEYLKRIDDNRPAIILEEGMAQWRWSRG